MTFCVMSFSGRVTDLTFDLSAVNQTAAYFDLSYVKTGWLGDWKDHIERWLSREVEVQGPSPPLSSSLCLMELRMYLLSISSSDAALWLSACLSRAILSCSSSSQRAMPPGCKWTSTVHTCATTFGQSTNPLQFFQLMQTLAALKRTNLSMEFFPLRQAGEMIWISSCQTKENICWNWISLKNK